MSVPVETGERCQCHSNGRTRPALLPCRDLLSLGRLENESLHCRHNRPLPVDFNTHPWPAYRHVTDPSYPENLLKRAVGAALAPVFRRSVPLAGQARRLWSFARLKAQCPNLHASVVVLGTPEIQQYASRGMEVPKPRDPAALRAAFSFPTDPDSLRAAGLAP